MRSPGVFRSFSREILGEGGLESRLEKRGTPFDFADSAKVPVRQVGGPERLAENALERVDVARG